jgi:hypothetical protein
MGKLAAQNFPTTIDEGTVARFNHAEQASWKSFKSTLLLNRSELIFSDLDTLERTFNQYSDADYLKERFIKLAPAIRPHANVIHGLVLSFSVTLTELMSRPTSSKKRSRTSASSSNASVTSSATSDDGTIDDTFSSTPPYSGHTSSSSASSSSSSSSSSSLSTSGTGLRSLQDQIHDLTRLVQLSLGKNVSGASSQQERPARHVNPATPNSSVITVRTPLTQEPSITHSPNIRTSINSEGCI